MSPKVIKANYFFDKTSFKGPSIILDGLKTPENIGSIFRLAGNISCKEIIFTERVEFNKTKIEKIARNGLKYIDVCFLSYEEIKNRYSHLVAIETCSTAENIYESKMPQNSHFIVGNERFGISDELLSISNQQVYIPMPGMVKSLNVSHALSIGIFEWYRQNYNHSQ